MSASPVMVYPQNAQTRGPRRLLDRRGALLLAFFGFCAGKVSVVPSGLVTVTSEAGGVV
ncbi:hypothetical protein ABZ687_29205 [Streptomyces ardesiacus]|uniref:hypothetical protein n=1 Tax=Streptomyces ardesiacus TaxID=285564 RepID=UPI0033E19228